jgi:hypothetical protein
MIGDDRMSMAKSSVSEEFPSFHLTYLFKLPNVYKLVLQELHQEGKPGKEFVTSKETT